MSPGLGHGLLDGWFLRSAGSRHGRPLVLIHGLGESGLCFEGLLREPELGEWRLLAPDMPGYGRSAWPASPLGLLELTDRLAEWLRAGAASPALVLGHSLGGVLGILLAERHPRDVVALVNVDGNVCAEDCVFSGQAAGQSLQEFERMGFDRLRERIYRDGLEQPALRGYYASLRQADPGSFHLHGAELLELSGSESLARRQAALTCPSIYLAGVPGGASPRSHRLLAEAGVAVESLEPAGHWPFIDQPQRFLELLCRFLTGRRVAARADV